MASIGHIAVGMATARLVTPHRAHAGRLLRRSFYLSVLSMLPDADVIGFPLGVSYDQAFGHRGASHSFFFAALVGLIAWLSARALQARMVEDPDALSPRQIAWLAALVVASHPVLDMLTDGGLGCALLFPFSTARYFWPIRPIPVAPIGIRFFSSWGWHVLTVETLYFLPFLLYALVPRRLWATVPATRGSQSAWPPAD